MLLINVQDSPQQQRMVWPLISLAPRLRNPVSSPLGRKKESSVVQELEKEGGQRGEGNQQGPQARLTVCGPLSGGRHARELDLADGGCAQVPASRAGECGAGKLEHPGPPTLCHRRAQHPNRGPGGGGFSPVAGGKPRPPALLALPPELHEISWTPTAMESLSSED